MGNIFNYYAAQYNSSCCYWVLGSNLDTESLVRQHAQSFFRFTYRRNMSPLLPSNLTSDAGWGCMLRAAQMLVAHALKRHHFNGDTTLQQGSEEYHNFLRLFVDYPGYPHLYSLHRMVEAGLRYHMQPGQWYGPSTASYVLRDLARSHCSQYRGSMEVLVTQGNTIYRSEVESVCTGKTTEETRVPSPQSEGVLGGPTGNGSIGSAALSASHAFYDPLMHIPPESLSETASDPPSSAWSCSLLVLIPLRLGISHVNAEYIEDLTAVLRHPNSVGFVGGSPNHALYFVGYSCSRDKNNSAATGEGRPERAGGSRYDTAEIFDYGLNSHTLDQCNQLSGMVPSSDSKSRVQMLGLDPHSVFNNPPRPHYYNDQLSTAASSPSSTILNDKAIHQTISLPKSEPTKRRKGRSSVRDAGNVSGAGKFPPREFVDQIHTAQFTAVDVDRLDPSMAIGFYFRSKRDFDMFCEETTLIEAAKLELDLPPLYTVRDRAPSFLYESNIGENSSDEHLRTAPSSDAEKQASGPAVDEEDVLPPADQHELVANRSSSTGDDDSDYVFI